MNTHTIGVALRGDATHLNQVLEQAARDISRFDEKMNRLGTGGSGGLRQVEQSAKRTKTDLTELGQTATVLGAAAAAGFGKMAFEAANFESAMSGVKAATRESADGMGQLRDAAITAGARTVFSATEAAQAIEEMAKAGVSTQAILSGGLKGALDLAAAGQLEVADAAGIMATSLQQFGRPGSDATHVADLLAAAAGKAQGEVSDMGLALKYVGPVAHQMGVSIEETAGTIALLATNGILADQAGTSLRGMLSSLTSPSAKAADLMTKLGISVYDAQGGFVGFRGVAGQLQEALGGLTNSQRDAALGVLFGNEQLTAARILYAGGTKDVDRWTRSVNDQGFAAETAAIKLDNLKGDVEALSGSLSTVFIEGGSSATGALRGLTQAATTAVNAYGELPRPVQGFTTSILGLTAAFGTAGGAALLLVPRLAATKAALTATDVAAARTRSTLLGAGAAFSVLAAAAAADALGDYAGAAAVATIATRDLAHALEASGRGNFLDPEALKLFESRNFIGVGNDVDDAADALEKFATQAHQALDEGWNARLGRWQDFGQQTGEFNKRVQELDAAFAEMVGHGDAETATYWFGRFSDAAKANGVDVGKLKALFPEFNAAIEGAATSSSDAAAAARDQARTYRNTVSPAVEEATDAVQGYKDSLDALNGVNIAAFRQQIALKKAFNDVAEAIGKSPKVTLDEKSALADLADQANATAKSIVDQGESQHKANRVLRESRGIFIDTAVQMGYTREQARELADELVRIPTVTRHETKTPGMQKAIEDAGKLKGVLDAINGTRAVAEVQVRASTGKLAQLAAAGYATGGRIVGAGTATSDSIMARLSNGEHVLTAREVAAAGGHSAVERWRRRLFDSVPGYARGGPVDHPASPQVVMVRVPVTESRTNTERWNVTLHGDSWSDLERQLRDRADLNSSPGWMGAGR